MLGNVNELGTYVLDRLEAFQRGHDIVGDVRGKGLLIGLEIVEPATSRADPEAAAEIQRRSLERGLILELGGRYDAVVRLLPPLNVSRETLDQALEILETVISEVAARVERAV